MVGDEIVQLLLGSAWRGHSLVTFAGPDGPSNLVTYSFACLGKSTVLGRALFRPNKKDIVDKLWLLTGGNEVKPVSKNYPRRGKPEAVNRTRAISTDEHWL